MRRTGGILWMALVLALTVRSGEAAFEPVHMAGRVIVVKGGKLAKFVGAPGVAGDVFAPPDADPTVAGGRLTFIALEEPERYQAFDLPPLGWTGLGSPAGVRGYRYRGAGSVADPCRTVVVKRKVVKAVCRGAGIALAPPFAGPIGVALVLGAGTDRDRYCAAFGGTEAQGGETLRRRGAPAPAACTCNAEPTRALSFAARAPTGTCGTLSTTSGPVPLDCGLIYFGGGQVGTPPFGVADMRDETVLNVECCHDKTLVLGPSASSPSGSGRHCTSAGCLFGPPMVVPNVSSTPQSVCVYPVFIDDAHGVARCDTGDVDVSLPIVGEAYLTGDILPKRCSGGTSPGLRCTTDPDCPGGGTCLDDNDLQPCPVCNPTTLVCNGGMNNGMACIPGSSEVTGVAFPTSRDCTVSSLVKVGEIPLPLALTTGTVTRTAVASGTQNRVYCGYCRDAEDSLAFEDVGGGLGRPCTSDADCAPPFAACEQRSTGAFSYPASSITTVGSPGGNISDFRGYEATLVGVFCLPPTFNPIIDAPSDLPGPGAATFPGYVRLSSLGGGFVD